MKEHMISQFIDDELGLDEKIEFVEEIHRDEAFTNEAREFLLLEKTLRSEVVEAVPEVSVPFARRVLFFSLLRPVNLAFMTMAAALVILTAALVSQHQETVAHPVTSHRFVLYEPGASSVEIAGNFTGWERVSMNRVGEIGYWELNLDLSRGEHRFVYLLEGDERILDPTVLLRERDDFDGENSVLFIGESA
ncbi:MAG TPA: hypothetical protein ENN34_13955 [Deltaproteobacteria bacterium]|nr:hypothetical protein [Deltaproteobacteria bacterium]